MFNKMNLQILGGLLAILVLLPLLFMSEGFAANPKEPITIGLVTWREGAALETGRLMTRAFNAGIKYINDRGGILSGRKVVGAIAPQGKAAETAKASALRLVMKDKAKALVGPMWAMAQPSGLEVAKRYNIPYTSFQGGNWVYQQGYPGVFVLSGTAHGRTNAQIKWANKMGFKRVACVLEDEPFTRDVESAMKAKWGKPDSPVKVVSTIFYDFTQTDLKKEVTASLGANPDLFWAETWSSNVTVGMLKELRELGFKGTIITDSDINLKAVKGLPKEITEGVWVNKEWAPDMKVSTNKAFCDLWLKEFKEMPDHDEEVIWSETVLLLLAMDKAGTAGDGTMEGLMKIMNAVRGLNWVGPRGVPVKLSKGGLAIWENIALAQISNKEFVSKEYIPLAPDEWLPFKVEF
jgi:branched-chain amino acid transport system substrate-binding protein